ncbi:hypothetical protein [Bordetella sp. LUAb4]|uniref:hypothetical protein n=1 Tax=Bordetella sp. LUAb4 TaxID=2843195 RepID=UPI001E5AAE7E|nr:hypothetical protein [Bordetella sp. LUAb4]
MSISIARHLPTPAFAQTHQPLAAFPENSYWLLADESPKQGLGLIDEQSAFDLPSADGSSKRGLRLPIPRKEARARRDVTKDVVHGQRIFVHHVNSEDNDIPDNLEALRQARYTTTAEAEAALDKLDGIVQFYAPYQAKAFMDHVREFVDTASQYTRSIRISVSMGINLTHVEGISPDAADLLVANRLREAVRSKFGNIPVETRAIHPDDVQGVVILWEAFDGPASNISMTHRTQHSEF